MPREDVEVVRACLEARERGDFETSLSFYTEDAEWQFDQAVDTRIYRGPDGVARAMEQWVGAFRDYWLEHDQLIDAGGGKVVLLWRQGGEGKTSGVQVEDEGATVFTVEAGRIAGARFYLDRAEALEAVGLRE